MAFIKNHEFKGYTPKYWHISSVSDNKADNTTRVIMSLFKDKATRISNPTAIISTMEFQIEGVDFKRNQIYPIVKTIRPLNANENDPPFFADATDDNDNS